MSRVALIGENSIGYVNVLLDIWNNGDCGVLLDWRIPSSRALEMMFEADVHTCYIERDLLYKFEKTIPNSIQFITYDKQNISAELLPSYIYDKFQEEYSDILELGVTPTGIAFGGVEGSWQCYVYTTNF